MIVLGKNAGVRKKAIQLVKVCYFPLLLIIILQLVLKFGTSLAVHLVGGSVRGGGLGATLLCSMLSEALQFFLVLGAYRMCVEQVRGAETSFFGVGLAFRGRDRIWNSFVFYLLFQIPDGLSACLSILRRLYPSLAGLEGGRLDQWFTVTNSLIVYGQSLALQLGVEMVLFPVMLLFVLHPGRGAGQAFGRGIPLGFRRWPTIVLFRALNALPAVLVANVVSGLVGTAVYGVLAPSTPEGETILSMMGMLNGQAMRRAQFWSDWARGLSGGVVTALALPWLRMCDVLFAGERLGLEVAEKNEVGPCAIKN